MSGKKEEPPKKPQTKPDPKKDKKDDKTPPLEEQTCFEKCTGWPDWTKYLLYATPPIIIATPFIARYFRCRQCPKPAPPKPKPKPKDPCCPSPPPKKCCKPTEKEPPC